MYTITEIIEFESSEDGLHCIFKLEGDESNTARVISDDQYYDWVHQMDESRDYYISASSEEDDYDDFNPIFDFNTWKSDNETEDFIINYIYENYELNDLPESEKIKKKN